MPPSKPPLRDRYKKGFATKTIGELKAIIEGQRQGAPARTAAEMELGERREATDQQQTELMLEDLNLVKKSIALSEESNVIAREAKAVAEKSNWLAFSAMAVAAGAAVVALIF